MGKRVIIIILDGVGVGELPDAAKYQDEGSNTLGNLAETVGGLSLPTLESLGLGKIIQVKGMDHDRPALGAYGKMAEASPGKDSTTGHWEICGVILSKPFATYPNGFPTELIEEFEKRIGRKTIGNVAASGTEIIEKLGTEHIKTGYPIIYTSADSVFQIAAHKEVIPLMDLYRYSEIARKLLNGSYDVGRVIARPFVGKPGAFKRTSERKDYSIVPPEPTLLDVVKGKGFEVWAIGKVDDLFGHQGYTKSIHSVINDDCMKFLDESLDKVKHGVIIATLVQFDMDWGHRNDPKSFHQGLLDFDRQLGILIKRFQDEDLVFITADHGCDPTTPSTDHSREYVPVLVFGTVCEHNVNLGTRSSFTDLAQTANDYFGFRKLRHGKSFFPEISKAN